MSNPAFKSMPAFSDRTLSAQELEQIYNQPAAVKTGQVAAQSPDIPAAVIGGSAKPMTYENTVSKTAILFGILIVCAAVAWFVPVLTIPGAIAALVLGLVIVFKKQVSVPLIVLHAAAEGLFVGGISATFETQWDGIVGQAVLGTLIVFAIVLALFSTGKVRASSRMNKIVTIAIMGYAAFSLVNIVLMLTGIVTDPWGLRGVTVFGIPLGVIVGALAIFLASYSLVMDFDQVQKGVQRRLPEQYAWLAGFGLVVTLVWLYVEILRLLAILRGSNN